MTSKKRSTRFDGQFLQYLERGKVIAEIGTTKQGAQSYGGARSRWQLGGSRQWLHRWIEKKSNG
jgi:hypothetical protein